MSNAAVLALAWVTVIVHVAVGSSPGRDLQQFPLIPLVNLAVAACVLLYWGRRWYSYPFNGIAWYGTDQRVALYAVALCALSEGAIAGLIAGTKAHRLVLAVNGLTCVATALCVSRFPIKRFKKVWNRLARRFLSRAPNPLSRTRAFECLVAYRSSHGLFSWSPPSLHRCARRGLI